jgi:CheY-like chemotaxis protein
MESIHVEMNRSIEVLLVEDSDADVELVSLALEEVAASGRLHVVGDGDKAIAFLRREGIYTRAVRPDLILLDLNLPRKHGCEVLAEIKADNDLSRIPVVILTSSRNPEDVMKAYEFHANCYIVKPFTFDHFINTLKAIEEFWCRLATLPLNRLSHDDD